MRFVLFLCLPLFACGEDASSLPQHGPIHGPSFDITIIDSKEIAGSARKRGVVRAVLHVDAVPGRLLTQRAGQVVRHKIVGTWDEITIFIYLPEMSEDSLAWGVARFIADGEDSFAIQKHSLNGTPYEPETK